MRVVGNGIGIEVSGGTPALQKRVREAVSRYPAWFVRAARVSRFEISDAPEVRDQLAVYQHGTRIVYVWSKIGGLLQKALGHELAHAIDDNFDQPHAFSGVSDWQQLHRNQSNFDIPKYGEIPLEYFADIVTKYFMYGPQKLSTTHPSEVVFINNVFKILQEEFGS